MKIQFFSVVFTGLFLAGCASGVKLDDVPVEDKAATATSSTPTGVAEQGIGSEQGSAQISAPTGVAVQSIGSEQGSAQISAPVTVELPSEPGQGPVGITHVVFFDFDSYVLRAVARPVIASHAQFLQKNPNRKANLEGHTDDIGGREYNLALGQKRADAVRQSLGLLGVPEAQMEAVSFGKEKLLSMGSSEMEQAQNRRVEIRY